MAQRTETQQARGGADAARRRRRRRREDRPYLILLFGLLMVVGAMAFGPVRTVVAANDRVDELTEQRDILAEDVRELERRSDALSDPARQEAYAREELGLVRPGDIPYVVVPEEGGGTGPADDASEADDGGDAAGSPWYERLVDGLASLFGVAAASGEPYGGRAGP